MNQDLTVQKKQYLSEKKKIRTEGFTRKKKIPAHAVSEKKKFVQAENSPPPTPPPPITFLKVRHLGLSTERRDWD